MLASRPPHVSVFLPRDNDFYRGLLGEMQRGFAHAGATTSGRLGLLEADDMRAWCAAHSPDLVFEMNRPRCDVDGLPRDVRHACWIVDLHARPIAEFQGSELTYLFCNAWVNFYPNEGFFRWLGPGSCDEHYPIVRQPEHAADFAFAGHIPNPWTERELNRDATGGAGTCTFGEILPLVEERLRERRRSGAQQEPPTKFLADIDAMCREISGCALVTDEVLRYDLLARIVRHINRTDLIDGVLTRWNRLAIYGPDNWSRWPAYRDYYRGWLSTPQALHTAYVQTRCNLHEGVGIHFRSMNIMGAGGLLAFRERHSEALPGGLRHEFAPHVHYVPFDLDTIAEDLAPYLEDPARAQEIRDNAAREIAARHTWKHRAAEILADLAQL